MIDAEQYPNIAKALAYGLRFERQDDWSVDHQKEFDCYEEGGPTTCEIFLIRDADGDVLASLGCCDDYEWWTPGQGPGTYPPDSDVAQTWEDMAGEALSAWTCTPGQMIDRAISIMPTMGEASVTIGRERVTLIMAYGLRPSFRITGKAESGTVVRAVQTWTVEHLSEERTADDFGAALVLVANWEDA